MLNVINHGNAKKPCHQSHTVELLWVHILLPGYPLTNTRWVPGYPFIGCRVRPPRGKFRALNGYPGSIFITQVVPWPAGTRVPGYPFTALTQCYYEHTYMFIQTSRFVCSPGLKSGPKPKCRIGKWPIDILASWAIAAGPSNCLGCRSITRSNFNLYIKHLFIAHNL